MNSKDLLSINEAFAKATSKVTTDQPAKKDEVVAEAKCEHCDGTGKHGEDDCSKCEGTGVIKETSTDSNTNMDNIMGDYENSLSKNFGVKNVKEKAAGEGFKKPDEKVSEVDSKSQRPKGEVNAAEKSKDVGGATEDLQEPVEGNPKEEEKKPKKKKKLAKESINNSNKGNIMSEDKSIFDKLYESVMGEDDDFELGIPGDEDPAAGDEFGDEGGEEVTVTLTPDQAAALKAVVDQLPSDDEEELGDVGDDDPLADTDEFEDSVQEDTTQTGDGKKPGTDPSDGGGKTTDPAADSLGGKSTGDGAVPVTDKEGTEQTGDGKKVGVAKNSGKPGKLAV
tara:strand:+ start:106 stop:1116 length:1011 start_codon:yes stop_codon:yes gene_type:complete